VLFVAAGSFTVNGLLVMVPLVTTDQLEIGSATLVLNNREKGLPTGPVKINWKFPLPAGVIEVKEAGAATLSVPSTARLLVSHCNPEPGVAGTIAAKLPL
jgi:hypothetical protein